jgi:hypothetical protein
MLISSEAYQRKRSHNVKVRNILSLAKHIWCRSFSVLLRTWEMTSVRVNPENNIHTSFRPFKVCEILESVLPQCPECFASQVRFQFYWHNRWERPASRWRNYAFHPCTLRRSICTPDSLRSPAPSPDFILGRQNKHSWARVHFALWLAVATLRRRMGKWRQSCNIVNLSVVRKTVINFWNRKKYDEKEPPVPHHSWRRSFRKN